jgi:hypothetical protein
MTPPTLPGSAWTSSDTIAPAWIACRGGIHSVVEGVVPCPDGLFSPWTCCLSCRHLETAEGDRDCEHSCSSEPAVTGAEDRIEPPLETWAALTIELL